MQIPCDKWEEIITTRQLEDLSSSERAALEEHLQSCLSCTHILDDAIAVHVRTTANNTAKAELTPRMLKLNRDIVRQRRYEELQVDREIGSLQSRKEASAGLRHGIATLLERVLVVALVICMILTIGAC